MKVRFKVYQFVRILECDVENAEQAERIAKAMNDKYPNMLFERYTGFNHPSMIDVFDLNWDHVDLYSAGSQKDPAGSLP